MKCLGIPNRFLRKSIAGLVIRPDLNSVSATQTLEPQQTKFPEYRYKARRQIVLESDGYNLNTERKSPYTRGRVTSFHPKLLRKEISVNRDYTRDADIL
jgi:hypothetical protein